MKETLYFHPSAPSAQNQFNEKLLALIERTKKTHQTPVLVCIGTDRVTGDCLGPLVGHYVDKEQLPLPIITYGTLKSPIHAKNLSRTLSHIYRHIPFPYMIGIDACLGLPSHIGYVTLSNHPLHPGKGLHKRLPPVGTISITGIVGDYGTHNFSSIQEARLYDIVQLASFIANGIINLASYLPL